MQLACSRCGHLLEYSRLPPRFCSDCGQPLSGTGTDPAVSTPHLVPPGPRAATPDVIGGYRLLRELGGGGMGTVYEAEEPGTGRRVALKLIRAEYADSPDAVERFRREGRLAGLVQHPRCVFVLAADLEAGRPYIVMELMPGLDLHQVVQARGPLPAEEAVRYILDVIEGLEEAHRDGVVHRDVKPSNCFLDAEGRVKVGDFGLAKSLVAEQPLTRTGAFLGTLLYASPEQIRNEPIDPLTDVYSVAATLFFLLTGRAPFEQGDDAAATLARTVTEDAPSLRAVLPELPRALDEVVRKGLARDRRKRWPSLEKLRRALRPFLRSGVATAGPVRRTAAYLLDWAPLAAGSLGIHLALLAVGLEAMTALAMPLNVLWSVAYFAIPEARWGWTPGKWLTGLRVRQARDMDRAPLWRATLRAACFFLLKDGPSFAVTMGALWFLSPDELQGMDVTTAALLLLGGLVLTQAANVLGLVLLASTMRRRTGCRGLHEFLSGTQTVWLVEERPPSRLPAARAAPEGPVPAGVPGQIGGYRVEALVHASGDEMTLRGQDEELHRPVWLWLRRGAAPLPAARREVVRATRPRWLAGGDEGGWRWEAFAPSPGCLLAELVPRHRRLYWAEMLAVLGPLADELDAAQRDGTLPDRLSLAQVRAHPGGRLQLLDMPLADGPAVDTPMSLLRQAAALGLEGRPRQPGEVDRRIEAPVPVGAAAVLGRLMGGDGAFASPGEVRDALSAAGEAPTEVTRPTRALQSALAALALAPGLLWMFSVAAFVLVIFWVVAIVFAMLMTKHQGEVRTEALAASTGVVAGPDLFTRLTAATWRAELDRRTEHLERERRLASAASERGLQSFSPPMRAALAPFAEQQRQLVDSMGERRWGPLDSGPTWPDMHELYRPGLFALLLGAWPLVWAVWAALTRGGLTLRLAGVALLGRDGRPAPRWRCAVRALAVWAPVWGLLYLSLWLDLWRLTRPAGEAPGVASAFAAWLTWWLAVALVAAYPFIALRWPNGGPHDRLAGTYPVPR